MEQVKESLSVLLIPIYDAEGRFDMTGAIFWCIFLAVVAVLVAVRVQNITYGKVIRTLREKKAFSEESAIPVSELGKSAEKVLKSSSNLFLLLREKKSGESEAEKPAEGESEGTERIYLPKKSRRKADALLRAGATPVWLAILETVGLYALLFTIYQILPYLLEKF